MTMMPAFPVSVNFFFYSYQTTLVSWRVPRILEFSGYGSRKKESLPGRSLEADTEGESRHHVSAGPKTCVEVGEVEQEIRPEADALAHRIIEPHSDRHESGLRRKGRTFNRENVRR